ncbi:MAG TPA: Gfo/Idh/MocA family oxidoreductase [Ignavibacteriaceae bacterium]|nr:Gfo/Idh/MocA family oxidoreductase [Ignavibacteriaceae bacterium]
MKIGIIGLGYWGPNLVRNFLSNKNISKVVACDIKEERLNHIKSKFPGINVTKNYKDLIEGDFDGIVIALPVDLHYKFAKEALLAGKHIWVEKPFTSKVSEAEDLIKIAEEKKLKIFVDHTFLYTGAVKKIKELVTSGELGDIIYFDSIRINLGLFQHDINVIWDLAPHDLSIMKYLIPNKQVSGVTACGISNYYELENLAHVSLHFENSSCFAHFHVNWTSPVKIRRMIIAGKKKMLVYDDMENTEKIKIFDCGVDVSSAESLHDILVNYRTGDMYSPKVEQIEALSSAVSEFVNCIINDRLPLTNAYDGLEIVKMLEASDASIKNNGVLVNLNKQKPLQLQHKIKVAEWA